jgi:dihydrofolate reductase
MKVDFTKTRFSIIAAIANNNVIGKDGKIPWHLSEDLKRFRFLTENHVVIMGQKTFESLNSVPLQNRFNIILTNNYKIIVKNYQFPILPTVDL